MAEFYLELNNLIIAQISIGFKGIKKSDFLMLVDYPVKTVTEHILDNSPKKPIIIDIPFLKYLLYASSVILSLLTLNMSPLTLSRVKKLFKSTEYKSQSRYTLNH